MSWAAHHARVVSDAAAQLAAHTAAADPHAVYLSSPEGDAKIVAHTSAVDPHPTYTTAAELAAAIAAIPPPSGVAYVGCRAYADGTQNVSNDNYEFVQFAQESFDTSNIHGADTTKFTVPAGKAGKWHVEGRVVWDASGGGTVRSAIILKNNANPAGVYASTLAPSASPYNQSARFYDVLQLAVGDYIQIQVYQDRGGVLTINSAFLVMSYLGS